MVFYIPLGIMHVGVRVAYFQHISYLLIYSTARVSLYFKGVRKQCGVIV